MAGQLTIDTLKASSGVLATQNGMTGIAKAWVNFDGKVSIGTIRTSFNVSSITVNGTGDYTVNFTTAMPSSSYGIVGMCGNTATDMAVVQQPFSSYPPTASAARFNTVYGNGTVNNNAFIGIAVYTT